MKTPFDALLKFAPKATLQEEAEAKKLGVDVATYRATKLQVLTEAARQRVAAGDAPPPLDIRREEAEAMRRHAQPGLLKPRNTAPSLFVQAAKTPGEVAKMILFVLCYIVGLILLVTLGGTKVTKLPGIFQCLLLGVLILPAMWASERIWAAIGERARDVIRLLVRFWPLTLLALFVALVFLKALWRGLAP